MTVKVVAFEGVDYSGKSSTMVHLAKRFSKREDLAFNEGPVYATELTARLLVLANQSNDLDREFLYTMAFTIDQVEASKTHQSDDRIVFQDRYWPSVVAYGRFLNKNNSIHMNTQFRELFLPPASIIYFSCSLEEKIKRSRIRSRKSALDRLLLGCPDELLRLEKEIDWSLEGLPNVFRIDTTHKSVEQVSSEIERYVSSLNLTMGS